jgi:hypothetical protein
VRLARDAVVVVRVRDVPERDRHAVLLHGGDVRERHAGEDAVEAGKADVPGGVLDDVAEQVLHRELVADLRRDVLVAEECVEPRVPARLVGEQIRPAVVRGRAKVVTAAAVDRDADEVGERLSRVRGDLGGLG